MSRLVFRVMCAANGVMFLVLALYGLVAPNAALKLMSGFVIPDDPQLISLMRMHVATDLGLGLAFLLVAYRPLSSFAAFVLGIVANVSHGMVHVVEELHGTHAFEHALAIVALVIMSAVLVVFYPWKEATRRFLQGG
jgi:hypothetical protein